MKAELVYCTKFDWIAASKDAKERRKATPYAALSALERSEMSWEEFKRTSSGYVTHGAHQHCCKMDRETAMYLFEAAVRNGFVDC
jgi:hypothetical protein